jgi:hypothetical protein
MTDGGRKVVVGGEEQRRRQENRGDTSSENRFNRRLSLDGRFGDSPVMT